MELSDLNHWWESKKVMKEFTPDTFRDMFYAIWHDLHRRQVKVIIGLRRTGKSTILFQSIKKLLDAGVDPFKILYITFDDIAMQGADLEDILKNYSTLTKIDYKKERIYLFLDEIQKSKDWVSKIKLLHDNLRNLNIILSGSASLSLLSTSKTTLAGRAIYYELQPLSFEEFLSIRGLNEGIKQPDVFKDRLKREFEDFKLRPLPELINERETVFIKNYIQDAIISPILIKDIPFEFKDVDIILMQELTRTFLSEPGQYLNVDNISSQFKRAKLTVYKALSYLEASFLIRKALNFRPSVRTSSRKLPKVYAYHPILTVPFGIDAGKFMENLVFSQLGAKYYWREKEKEVDFISESTPIEVKFQPKITSSDMKWLKFFIGKYSGKKHAYMITKEEERESDGIRLIPAWKFALFGLNDTATMPH